jgi:type II secretory pathway pseudopilin PulG
VETVGIILLLFFLIFATLAAVALVKTTRAVRRGVERRTAQARRVVEDQRLRARRFAQPGDIGALTQLRLDLRSSIDSTFDALDRVSLPEAAALLDRLNEHARALDGELKLLEREPDKARVAAQLPSLTDRTHRITHSADALRWAAQDRVHHASSDDLAALTRDIDIEATALRHWEPIRPPDDRPSLPDQQ